VTPLGPAGPDLTVRLRQAELMDDPDLDPDRHARALRALERVNRVSLTARRVWREVRDLHARLQRPVRLLDVACGGGDVLRDVGRAARGAGVGVELHGCDASPRALDLAGRVEASDPPLELFRLDATSDDLPAGFDLLTCSLFLHHLERPAAVRLLRGLAEACAHRILIQDLRRTALGYAFAWVGLHTLTRSEVARVDGLRSVRAAFSAAEAEELCADAGMPDARVRLVWPQRFTIAWSRT
jgi:2-polyprenyl-3-methyl-5-hydroxy-6-metoxy-1,4-benzoquinol methylase